MPDESHWLINKIKTMDLRLPVRKYRKAPAETTHPTKACAAILKQARAAGFELPGPDEFYRIRRVHAGHHQRSAGAWSWSLGWTDPANPFQTGPTLEANGYLGSRWPAAACAKAGARFHQNNSYGTEMIPEGAEYR